MSEISDTSDSNENNFSRRSILRRQKQELKNFKLEWKNALKNSKSKGSKREINSQFKKKEQNILELHKKELSMQSNNIQDNNISINIENQKVDELISSINDLKPFYIKERPIILRSYQKKQKKRMAQAEKDQRMYEECILTVNKRDKTEMEDIIEKLKKFNLSLYTIKADGNCLFGAIKHQLEIKGIGNYSIKQLRNIAANYIQENRQDIEPFILSAIEGSTVTFEEYCNCLRNTNEWGGEVELVALSKSLKVPIVVICGLSYRNEYYGLEFENHSSSLYIVYHLYLYATGPHYNSTIENY
ncbi:OTU-like cysteine protease family protein [Cryptosporidium andersoni]|uniref:OTU-like cysteine protease family protein n=1 Tax=Cryptosporidium andersoni TaxID=117008 RepID=A0A1J4MSI4_9CRYT|nr:OTU-like cysteine protease family protein [Cryptosporidium andersoni]